MMKITLRIQRKGESILKLIFLVGIIIFSSTSCSNAKNENPANGFDHVMLYVSDIEKTISFYTKSFGMKVDRRIHRLIIVKDTATDTLAVKMAFLIFPDQTFFLELSERDSLPDANQLSPHFQHIGINTLTIEDAYQKAIENGASQGSGIRNVHANDVRAKNAFFRGPDGERIELIQWIK